MVGPFPLRADRKKQANAIRSPRARGRCLALLLGLMLPLSPATGMAQESGAPPSVLLDSLASQAPTDSSDYISASFYDLLSYDFKLETQPGQQWAELGISFLEPGSEVLSLEGLPLRAGEDYRLDAELGKLELYGNGGSGGNGGEWPGGTLWVRVRKRPLALPRLLEQTTLRAWQDLRAAPVIPAGDLNPLRNRSTAGPQRFDPGTFVLGGSKAVVLKVGSDEDVTVEQSLRLNLQGQLSDSTRVEAVLRDDELPYQPEGNTERLEELDKVYLRVEGPQGKAQVGDFVFTMNEREITPFQRDFKGIQGDWRGSLGGLSAWLARSQGVFRSTEFYGVDGVQGPYELLSALRDNRAVILAGSETVRVNGKILTRGRDRDYTIDYDLGSLTFTARAAVSAADIVRVDFRYSQENWQRGAWGAGGRTRLGALRIDYLHFQEEDDPENPLAFQLDEERRAILEAAGDDIDAAVTSGIIPRPGEGSYVSSHENDEDPDFVTYTWVDSLGNYDLQFREVEPDQGDYQFVGISQKGVRIFAYAKPGGGSFALGEQLVAPEGYRLESLVSEMAAGPMRLETELSISHRDANLLSTLDDRNNDGIALRGGFGLGLGRVAGRPLALELQAQRRDDLFRYPGQRPGAEHYRRWNLPWDPGLMREETAAASLGWGDLETEGLEIKSEALRLGARFEGLRGSFGLAEIWGDYRWRGAVETTFSADSILGDGRRDKAVVDIATAFPLLRGAAVDWERNDSERGDSLASPGAYPEQRPNFDRQGIELRLGARGGVQVWSLNWREEGIRSGRGLDRLTRIVAGYHEGLPGAGRLDLLGRYQKRRGFAPQEQFLVESRAVWVPRPGGWGGGLFYQLGSRNERLRESQLVYVGQGQGNLNEWGVYVGEGEGDYRRVSLPGEAQLPVNELELEAKLQRAEAVAGSWWRRLGSESRVTVREQTSHPDFWALARLAPAILRQPDSSLFGEIEYRQELRYRVPGAGPEFRYRFNGVEFLDQRDSFTSRRSRSLEHQLRLRQTGTRGEVQLELSHRLRRREDDLGLGGGNYDTFEQGADLSGTRHLHRRLRLTMGGGLSLLNDRLRSLALRRLVLEPGIALSPLEVLRLEGSWEFSNSDYLRGDPRGDRPWFFDAAGWKRTLRLQATLQAGAFLTLSAQYELRDEIDRPQYQRMRMEGRAYF